MRYTAQAQQLLLTAAQRARTLGHSYVGSVHLLMALTQYPGFAGQMLRFAGCTPMLAEKMSVALFGAGTADLPQKQSGNGGEIFQYMDSDGTEIF